MADEHAHPAHAHGGHACQQQRLRDACKGMSEPGAVVAAQSFQGWLTRVTAVLAKEAKVYVWVQGLLMSVTNGYIPGSFEAKYRLHAVSILDHDGGKGRYSFVCGVRNVQGEGGETVMTFRCRDEEHFMDWFSVLYGNCFAVMNNNALLAKAADCGRLIDRIGDVKPFEITVGMLRFIRQQFPRGEEDILRFLKELEEEESKRSFVARFARDTQEQKDRKKYGKLMRYMQRVETLLLSSGVAECGGVETVLTLDLALFPSLHTLRLRHVEVKRVVEPLPVKTLHVKSCVGSIACFNATRTLVVKRCEKLEFDRLYEMAHSLETLEVHSFLQTEDLQNILRVPGAGLPLPAMNALVDSGAQRWANLHSLDLSHNLLTSLPSELSQLRKLKTLILDYNDISSLRHVRSLKQLVHLSVSHNNVDDAEAACDLKHLTVLNLSTNRLTAVNGFSGLTNMLALDISHNNITDWRDIFSLSQSLTRLESLHLEGNPLQQSDYVPLVRTMFSRKLLLDGRKVSAPDRETMDEMAERYHDRAFQPKEAKTVVVQVVASDGASNARSKPDDNGSPRPGRRTRVVRKGASKGSQPVGEDAEAKGTHDIEGAGKTKCSRVENPPTPEPARAPQSPAAAAAEVAQTGMSLITVAIDVAAPLSEHSSDSPSGKKAVPVRLAPERSDSRASSQVTALAAAADEAEAVEADAAAEVEAAATDAPIAKRERQGSCSSARSVQSAASGPKTATASDGFRRTNATYEDEQDAPTMWKDVQVHKKDLAQEVKLQEAGVSMTAMKGTHDIEGAGKTKCSSVENPLAPEPARAPQSPAAAAAEVAETDTSMITVAVDVAAPLSEHSSDSPSGKKAVPVRLAPERSDSRASSQVTALAAAADEAEAVEADAAAEVEAAATDAPIAKRERQGSCSSARSVQSAASGPKTATASDGFGDGFRRTNATYEDEQDAPTMWKDVQAHKKDLAQEVKLQEEEVVVVEHEYSDQDADEGDESAVDVVLTQEMRDFALKVTQSARGLCWWLTSGFLYIFLWYRKYWRSLEKREWATLQKVLVVVCHVHLVLVVPFVLVFAQLPCDGCDAYEDRLFRYYIAMMILCGSAFQTLLGIYALFYESEVMLVFFNLLTLMLATRYIFNMVNYLDTKAPQIIVVAPPIFEIAYELFFLTVSCLVWPHFNRLVFYRVGGGPHLVKVYKWVQIFAALARTDLLFISLSAIIAGFWYIKSGCEWVLMSLVLVASLVIYNFAISWVLKENRRNLLFFMGFALAVFGVQFAMMYSLCVPDKALEDHLKSSFQATVYTVLAALVVKVLMLASLAQCFTNFEKGLKEALEDEEEEVMWGVPTAQV